MSDDLREEQEAYKRERDTISRKDTGRRETPVPQVVMPTDPSNIKLSKSQFVAKMRKDAEKRAKIAAFAEEVERGIEEKETPVIATPVHAIPEENTLKKPKGRPKKNVA